MKKRLFSLALTLALCLGLAVPAFAADTSGLDANTRKAYYDVLTAQINKYGIVSANGKKGVEYAALEDMDADGTPELIVICFPEDDAYDACIFVWKMRNGKAVQTVNETSIYPGGAVSEANVFLVRQPGKTAVCHYFGYFYRDWLLDEQGNPPAPTYNLYYVDGTVETVESIDEAWKEDDMKVFGGDGYWWHEEKATEAVMQLRSDLAKAPVSGGFTDVKAGAYYADAVKWAVDRKITSGTSATTFSPDQTCTVAQILTFLWNANGQPEPTGRNPFSDISSGDYFYKAAVWAASKGLVSGTRLNPNAPCTRAMVVEYLWKLAGSPSMNVVGGYSSQTITGTVDGTPCSIEFSAANIKETTLYITTHDKETVKKKVTFITVQPGSKMTIKGVPFIFIDEYANEGNGEYVQCGPMEPMEIKSGAFDDTKPDVDHRGNSAYGGIYHPDTWKLYFTGKNGNPYFLHIAFDSVSFTDVPSDAAYAQAVAWAVENGVTAGTSDTTFSPGDTCTRGQIVTFLHRAMG